MATLRTWREGHRCHGWTVVSDKVVRRQGRAFYRCRCDCGCRRLIEAWRLDRNSQSAVSRCRSCAAKARVDTYAKELTRAYLNREYVKNRRSVSAIAQDTGFGLDAVRKRLRQCGITIRTKASSPVHFFSGQQIGKWRVGKKVRKPRGRTSQLFYRCICECGAVQDVYAHSLASGRSKACRKCGARATQASPHWMGHGELSGTHWHRICLEAEKRGYAVAIKIADAWRLFVAQEGKCALSGMPLRMRGRKSEERRSRGTASLDRIDSTRGYVRGNVQWVHKDVNLLKNNFDEEYLLQMCRLVVRKGSNGPSV